MVDKENNTIVLVLINCLWLTSTWVNLY